MRVMSMAAAFALLVVLTVGFTNSSVSRPDFSTTQSVGPLIGAHYYPWYEPVRWKEQPTADTPALGRYSSADRRIFAKHVQWAKQADLDFFILSCLDPHGTEAKNLTGAVLPEMDATQFRFALHYETPLALGLPPHLPIDLAAKLPGGTVAGDRLIEQFDLLADTYFHRSNYLRYGGRAVVMMYLVRNFENAGPYLRRMRERLAARGIELYLIADVVYWEKPGELDWPFLKEHFQAVTAYNMYPRAEFLVSVARQYQATDDAARARDMRMIPHVMPGYDDTRLRGDDRLKFDRRDGQFYRSFWNFATKHVGPDQPFLFITTFNEWHEGTELEPSMEYGDLYLRLTRELASELRKR